MQGINLLACSALNPEQLSSKMLQAKLNKTCSTWERQRQSIKDVHPGAVLAVTNDGVSYLSTVETGISELIAGIWLRKRISSGCHSIPLVNSARLNDDQRVAARMLLANPAGCLTGLPGTGKTYVLKSVFDSFSAAKMNTSVVSFTGSAASRLGSVLETTGSTIHRFLGYNGTCFEYNQNNPHPADVVIIDEAGMPGSVLHTNLLSALRDDCVVIYTGDPRQLGSIEPGNILSDVSSCLPHVDLTLVMRTDPDGPIGLAAQSMLSGEIPRNAEEKGNGFYSHPCSDDNLIGVGRIAAKKMSEIHHISFDRVRTLCPTNKLVREYNKYCFDKLEPGDLIPIIARKNSYEYNYFNGDSGFLEVDSVYFDDGMPVPYVKSDAVHALGWGSTVYVAQGKEFICSQLLIPRIGAGKPSFSEVYTAVTRAQSRFIVIGCMAGFAAAIKAKNANKRTSLLAHFINGTASVIGNN